MTETEFLHQENDRVSCKDIAGSLANSLIPCVDYILSCIAWIEREKGERHSRITCKIKRNCFRFLGKLRNIIVSRFWNAIYTLNNSNLSCKTGDNFVWNFTQTYFLPEQGTIRHRYQCFEPMHGCKPRQLLQKNKVKASCWNNFPFREIAPKMVI